MSSDVTSVGEVSPALSVYHWLAVVTVSADEPISKRDNCASIDCGPGACVTATVPFCECPPNYAGSRCEVYEGRC
ncbi:hypothetical protein OESDEN_24085 [Oesophagostomum dentatum]|uniref:EGF-like domain-containing protein n=1 Tax=Oesophagostomum dentatum TaxID=61180 RepID=A0A0B1RZB3_OESDE|nr:hypothetical protein OESDEN_24085 [Oesophagostomum dentatum]